MRIRRGALPAMLCLLVLAAPPACVASPASSQPASATTGPCQTQPTQQAPQQETAAVDPAAMKILLALEKAGEKYRTVQGDLEMTVLLPQLGDSERRTGWVAYQRTSGETGEKIRVHFETLQLGSGPNTRQREDYTFDGRWAVEAKHSVKQLTRWQVAAEGETVEPLRIGKGSFPPLPFGQKAAEVLEYYQAATRPQSEGDPPDADCVKLEARRARRSELHFLTLEMWVDRQTGLPVKIVGTDKDKNTKTVVLKNIKVDVAFAADMFELKAGFGWTVNTQPLPRGGEGEQP